MKKLLSKTRAAADRYGMLGQNEKIAVGVSGGKDSLMLLRLMAAMREQAVNLGADVRPGPATISYEDFLIPASEEPPPIIPGQKLSAVS